MFSNRPDALPLDPEDRRFFVWDSQAKPQNPKFYRELAEYVESEEGMNQIYTYLLRWDLSEFDPFAPPPVTNAKKALIDASADPLEEHVMDLVQSRRLAERLGDRIALADLRAELRRDGFDADRLSDRRLAELLRRAGATQVVARDGERRRRLWRLPTPPAEDYGFGEVRTVDAAAE